MNAYIAQIKQVGFNYAPRAWMQCNGQTLAINQNQALFSLLGTTYGGNGVTTFMLPDLRGRVMVGTGQLPGGSWNPVLGEVGGMTNVSLTVNEIPTHNHTLAALPEAGQDMSLAMKVSSGNATQTDPTNGCTLSRMGTPGGRGGGFVGYFSYNNTAPTTALGPLATVGAANLVEANTGASQAHSNTMPYLGIMHMICIQGIFPPRN
jgi:microcystin-dependent protein